MAPNQKPRPFVRPSISAPAPPLVCAPPLSFPPMRRESRRPKHICRATRQQAHSADIMCAPLCFRGSEATTGCYEWWCAAGRRWSKGRENIRRRRDADGGRFGGELDTDRALGGWGEECGEVGANLRAGGASSPSGSARSDPRPHAAPPAGVPYLHYRACCTN